MSKDQRRGGFLANSNGVQKLKTAKSTKKYSYQKIADDASVTLDQVKRLFNPQWGNGQYKIGEEAIEAICRVLDLKPTDIVDPNEWNPPLKQTQHLAKQNQQDSISNFLNQIITDFQPGLFHTTQTIILKDQYIPIQVTLERKYTHTTETTWSYAESEAEMKLAYSRKHSEDLKPTQVDWPEAKKQHQRLMVLADPGMGKTTLLKREAYLTAQAALQSLENNSQTLEDVVIPICLRLSEIADETQKEVTAKVSDAILKLLESKYEKYFPQIERFLTDRLKDGKCLLLLDALDEVPKEARNKLSEKLNTFIRNYDCSIICTSRIVGYSGAFLDKAKDVEIVPFNEPQINQYIETWFEIASEYINDDSVSAASLIRELQTKPQIRGLVQNPLLLSLICSLYQKKGITLPARRCEVYEQAVKYMLGKWTQNRQPQNEGRIKAKIRFLEQLAYNFSCAGKEIFSLDELYDQIEEYLQGDKVPTVFRNADTDELITELSEEDGILQKLHESGDQYLFLHRTFQEYFTASYLQRSTNGVELAKAHFWDYEWHETLTLMAGLMKNPVPLLEAILAERDDIFSTLLLLAGRCVAEGKESNNQVVREIIDRIYQLWCRHSRIGFIRSVIVAIGKTDSQLLKKLQQALSEAFNSEKSNFKHTILDVLAEIGTPQVTEILNSVSNDKDFSVRNRANWALFAIENPKKYEELNSCFKQNSDNESILIQNSFKEEVAKLYGTSISEAVKKMILELNHPEFYVRYGAAEDLGEMGEPDAVIPLISVLNDDDPRLRSVVAEALGNLGDVNAVEPLISVVKTDEDGQVKENAARALIKLGIFEGFDPNLSDFLKKFSEIEPIEFVILALDYKQEIIVNTLDWRELEEAIISGINHENCGASQMCKFIFCLSSRREMNEPRRTRRTRREKGIRDFLVLLRLFFQNWDAPENWEVKNIALSTLSKIATSKTLAKLIQIPEINIYDQDIFLLARQLAIRFSKEKVPFIPVYPELLGQSFDV